MLAPTLSERDFFLLFQHRKGLDIPKVFTQPAVLGNSGQCKTGHNLPPFGATSRSGALNTPISSLLKQRYMFTAQGNQFLEKRPTTQRQTTPDGTPATPNSITSKIMEYETSHARPHPL
jgi:hypothetical protein